MITLLTILIALVCVMLTIVVLSQNPKGGGLDPTFAGSGANQIFGAAKSADFIEKLTWYLAAALFALCIATAIITGSSTPADGIELLSQ